MPHRAPLGREFTIDLQLAPLGGHGSARGFANKPTTARISISALKWRSSACNGAARCQRAPICSGRRGTRSGRPECARSWRTGQVDPKGVVPSPSRDGRNQERPFRKQLRMCPFEREHCRPSRRRSHHSRVRSAHPPRSCRVDRRTAAKGRWRKDGQLTRQRFFVIALGVDAAEFRPDKPYPRDKA